MFVALLLHPTTNPLLPPGRYEVRVSVVNHVGRGASSEPLLHRTKEEQPEEHPSGLKVGLGYEESSLPCGNC